VVGLVIILLDQNEPDVDIRGYSSSEAAIPQRTATD